MHDEKPASEKLLYLIHYCLGRQFVPVQEIALHLDCCKKQAIRLMNKVHDMQYELGFIVVDLIKEDHIKQLKIRIQLDRKYAI